VDVSVGLFTFVGLGVFEGFWVFIGLGVSVGITLVDVTEVEEG
jgi:hypothetical protein